MPALLARQMSANHLIDTAWCPGCGLHHHVYGEHRPDCTAEPSPLICAEPDCDEMRLPSERGPLWQYQPTTHAYYCPDHHQKGTTT